MRDAAEVKEIRAISFKKKVNLPTCRVCNATQWKGRKGTVVHFDMEKVLQLLNLVKQVKPENTDRSDNCGSTSSDNAGSSRVTQIQIFNGSW